MNHISQKVGPDSIFARSMCLEGLESRRLLSSNLVADFGGIYPTDSVVIDGISYFSANDGTHGRALWKSDGTAAGTEMVKDLYPDIDPSEEWGLHALGDQLVIFTREGASAKMWISDGTDEGTKLLHEFQTDELIDATAVVNGRLVFMVQGGFSNPRIWIWSTDGTVQGTKQLAMTYDGDSSGYGHVEQIFANSHHVIIPSYQSLWVTDGTVAGTREIVPPDGGVGVGENHAGGLHWNNTQPWFDAGFNGEQYFFFDLYRNEVWATDGTVAGTVVLAQPTYILNSFHRIGSKVLMQGYDGASDTRYLWVSDGTAEGTHVLTEIPGGFLADSVQFNGRLYFTLWDENGGPSHFWTSDGTAAGTHEIKRFDTFTAMLTPVSVGGLIFFYHTEADGHTWLWTSDGTDTGTHRAQDLTSQIHNSGSVRLHAIEGKLVINDDINSWVLDPATMTAPIGPAQGSISLKEGVLRVHGTLGADSIRIYRHTSDADRFVVNLNGVKKSFAMASVSRIYIYGYSGDDNLSFYDGYGRVSTRSRIWGGAGNDSIYTGLNRDTLYGDEGDDSLNSGPNDDVLMGGDGDDFLNAGLGNDTAGGEDGSDHVNGGAGRDVLSGGSDGSQDWIDGGSGIDVMFGSAVFDTFFNHGDISLMDELLQG